MPQNPTVVRVSVQGPRGNKVYSAALCLSLIYWASVSDLIQRKSCLAKRSLENHWSSLVSCWETNPGGKKRKACPWSHSKLVAEPGWEPRSPGSLPALSQLLPCSPPLGHMHFPSKAEMVSTPSIQGRRLSEAKQLR